MAVRPRVRAPELRGRAWLNSGGRSYSLADFRGRVLLLDFWTFCCVNCLHVLDELRPLEARFPDELVVVGVHSAKFEHEADPEALAAAVERYGVHHLVLDDPDLATWQAYTARAWPTLVLVDPEGYIVASMSGEGHGTGLADLVEQVVAEHAEKGTLRRGDSLYVPPPEPESSLRFPGKVAALPGGTVVVSDTAHREVVHLDADLVTEVARFGGPDVFTEPQGVLVLPRDIAAETGADILVADSAGHRVVGLRLSDGRTWPVAGTGRQLRERTGGGPALEQDLSTPWDLAWFDGRVVIAMAGTHQLWTLDLAADPARGRVEVIAGTSAEGIRDGDGGQAWFAQPSGLAVSADASTLWVADSETSALRAVRRSPAGGRAAYAVETLVGQGLFDFGHRDGPAAEALLQHPLGVTVLPDGSVAVSDTYNGAVRRYDPASGEVSTLAGGLAEPSDALVEHDCDRPDAGSATLLVVESGAHRLTRVPLPDRTTRVDGPAHRTQRPRTEVASGPVELRVHFAAPTGQKLDDRWGDPTRLVISSTPDALLREGAGAAAGLSRGLVLDPRVGDGVLHVGVRAATCDGDPGTGAVPEHAACHLYQQDWGIPVVLADSAPAAIDLDLRGV